MDAVKTSLLHGTNYHGVTKMSFFFLHIQSGSYFFCAKVLYKAYVAIFRANLILITKISKMTPIRLGNKLVGSLVSVTNYLSTKIILLFLTVDQMLKQILTEDIVAALKNLKQLHSKKISLVSTRRADSQLVKLNFNKK